MRERTARSIGNESIRRNHQELDRYVGARLRERRIRLGLTQTQLAQLIGVSCQQLHGYERGLNRFAAGQLLNLAAALEVHPEYFYEGLVEPDA
jgi:transcriptional regulator with XRE-family HTH domain